MSGILFTSSVRGLFDQLGNLNYKKNKRKEESKTKGRCQIRGKVHDLEESLQETT